MNINEFFNTELDIKESYQLPDALIERLLSGKKNELLSAYIEKGFPIDVDTFNAYFEQGHSDRKNFMQDFTPSSITKIVENLAGVNESVLDVCAGVGGLSQNLESEIIYLEELSTRALPILLFTLAIKNKDAIVKNGDVLTGDYSKFYKLTKGERFSDIEIVEEVEDRKFDLIISNPPYSLKWEPKNVLDVERYLGYEIAPKSKADWAFVIGQLNRLKENGKMMYVFPHGVLFRGGAERKIREQLLRENLIDIVIGLPDKMFTNTDIPTTLLILKKNKADTDVLFIDASRECTLNSDKRNVFTEDNLSKLIATAKNKMEVKRFSHLATIEEIIENEYNLNIPRYVDTYIPEPVPDLIETLKGIFDVRDEIAQTERSFFKMFFDMYGTDDGKDMELKQAQDLIKERYGEIGQDM